MFSCENGKVATLQLQLLQLLEVRVPVIPKLSYRPAPRLSLPHPHNVPCSEFVALDGSERTSAVQLYQTTPATPASRQTNTTKRQADRQTRPNYYQPHHSRSHHSRADPNNESWPYQTLHQTVKVSTRCPTRGRNSTHKASPRADLVHLCRPL